jgi:hypothetical protein
MFQRPASSKFFLIQELQNPSITQFQLASIDYLDYDSHDFIYSRQKHATTLALRPRGKHSSSIIFYHEVTCHFPMFCYPTSDHVVIHLDIRPFNAHFIRTDLSVRMTFREHFRDMREFFFLVGANVLTSI